jgi:hypothetical protein
MCGILAIIVHHHQWYDLSLVSKQYEVIEVPVDVNMVIMASEEHHLSQNVVLDDNTLNPRNECCLLVSWLSRVIFEEVDCCSMHVINCQLTVFSDSFDSV